MDARKGRHDEDPELLDDEDEPPARPGLPPHEAAGPPIGDVAWEALDALERLRARVLDVEAILSLAVAVEPPHVREPEARRTLDRLCALAEVAQRSAEEALDEADRLVSSIGARLAAAGHG
jgi:hypothetical protein